MAESGKRKPERARNRRGDGWLTTLYRSLRPRTRRWIVRAGVIMIGAGLLLAWTYTPAPASIGSSQMMTAAYAAQMSAQPLRTSVPAGFANELTLILTQPADSHFASVGWEADPPGWYGRASCLLDAHNLAGQQMYAFGVVVDYLFEGNTIALWNPGEPIAAGQWGWQTQAVSDQQAAVDLRTNIAMIWAGAHTTLFNQTGAPIRDYTFTLVLAIASNGQFTCGILSTQGMGLRPVMPADLLRTPTP